MSQFKGHTIAETQPFVAGDRIAYHNGDKIVFARVYEVRTSHELDFVRRWPGIGWRERQTVTVRDNESHEARNLTQEQLRSALTLTMSLMRGGECSGLADAIESREQAQAAQKRVRQQAKSVGREKSHNQWHGESL